MRRNKLEGDAVRRSCMMNASRYAVESLESRHLLSTTIYVDLNSPGPTHNGTSWSNAFPDLQQALAASASGDEIRVADGTYKPTSGNDRSYSFNLKSGVKLKGGYTGFGGSPNPDTRDFSLYPSILSGDINGIGNNSDNSLHVVYANDVPATTTLDGFTISYGNANINSYPNQSGGGILISSRGPTITNCVFSSNSALVNGGAMFCLSASTNVSKCAFVANTATGNLTYLSDGGAVSLNGGDAIFASCSFTANSASGGGAVFSSAVTSWSDCTFTGNSSGSQNGGAINGWLNSTFSRCVFTRNNSSAHGGAIYGAGSSGSIIRDCLFQGNSAVMGGAIEDRSDFPPSLVHAPTILGSIFAGNKCTGGGGAIYIFGSPAPQIFNCTFSANSAGKGGAIYGENSTGQIGNTPFDVSPAAQLINCILWGNTGAGGQIYDDDITTGAPRSFTTASYCDIQGGFPGSGNLSVNPQFLRTPNAGADANWGSIDDDYGDVRLQYSSPCIDAGSNAWLPLGFTSDFSGGPRIVDLPGVNDPGAIVDMGAYEVQPNGIWDGGGDGINWTDSANWSNNVIPGLADDVVINVLSNPSIILNGAQTVRAVSASEDLTVNGTLSVSQASTINSAVVLAGGTLAGAGDMTFKGSLSWTGGTMSGTGKTIIASGGTMNINTGAAKTLARTIENSSGGQLNWNATITGQAGAAVLNKAGATITLDANGSVTRYFSAAGATLTNQSGGTIDKVGPDIFEFDGSVFNNQGVVTISSGTLLISGGGTHSGTFAVAANSAINLRTTANTFGAAAAITGSGTLAVQSASQTFSGTVNIGAIANSGGVAQFDGAVTVGRLSFSAGTTTFNGNVSINNGTSYFEGGLIDGTGNLTVSDTLVWRAGTMSGTGKTIIASGGLLSLSEALTKTLSREIQIQPGGVGSLSGGDVQFAGGTFTNSGTLTLGTSNAIPISGTNSFINNGTINVQAGAIFASDVPLNNGGTVSAAGNYYQRGGAATASGKFEALLGGAIRFSVSTYAFPAGSELKGAGYFEFLNAPYVVNSTITATGPMRITAYSGANLTVNTAVSLGSGLVGVVTGSTATFNGPVSAGNIGVGGASSATFNASVTSTGDLASSDSGSLLNFTGSSVTANRIILETGGDMSIQAGGSRVARTETLSITGGGSLDLNDNALIIDYLSSSPLTTVSALLSSGYNNGTWTGNGIMSTAAASTPGTAVGFGEASQLFSSFPATFAGQQVDDSAVLIRYTLSGDADLGRKVNTLDFNLLAGNFGLPNKVFSQGDFNYDNSVNSIDFGILVGQYGNSLPASASPSAASGAQTSGGVAAAAPAQAVFSAAGWNNDQPLDELV